MSWRDNLRPASFRGVAFDVSQHETDLGRRIAIHEFPLRDAAEVEDMGLLSRTYQVEAFVIGPDYDVARDALIEALEAPGTGPLIHPWLGQHMVALLRGRVSESSAEGGMARFQLEFFQPAPTAVTARSADTSGVAQDAATSLDTAAQADFAARFNIAGWPDFVSGGAFDVINQATDFITDARGRLTGYGAPLSVFIAQGQSLKSKLLTLARSPLDLALEVSSLIRGLRSLARTPSEALGVLRGVMGFGRSFSSGSSGSSLGGGGSTGTGGTGSIGGSGGAGGVGNIGWNDPAGLIDTAASGGYLRPVIGSTPARRQQRINQAAVVALVRHVAAAQAVDAISRMSFASYDEAIATRNSLTDQLDDLALIAADAAVSLAVSPVPVPASGTTVTTGGGTVSGGPTGAAPSGGVPSARATDQTVLAGDDDIIGETGPDAVYQALEAVRVAVINDVTARGADLARLRLYQPMQNDPALVVAHRLYADLTRLDDRCAEILARNDIAHPLFVPVRPLEVVSDV